MKRIKNARIAALIFYRMVKESEINTKMEEHIGYLILEDESSSGEKVNRFNTIHIMLLYLKMIRDN